MLPTINIGHLVFPTKGILFIFGAWIALSLVERAAKRMRLNPESLYGLAFTGLLAAFIGARLVFVALFWTAFLENPLGIVWPLTTGYNVVGGLIIGLAAAFFYGRAKQMPAATTLDALTPGLIFGFMIINLADFLAGPGYGGLTTLPWGISLFGVRRHPVQLYEIVVGFIALLVWWRLSRQRAFVGQPFLVTVALYSSGRLLFDAFRDNAWLTPGGWHIWQIISLAAMLICLFLLTRFSEGTPTTVQATGNNSNTKKSPRRKQDG